MAYTAESLFDYMREISDEVDCKDYSDDRAKTMTQETYDVLAAHEREEETLWTATDDVLTEALDMMENENFHTESSALIAYMHKMYGWEPEDGIQSEKDYAPYLYE